MENNMSEFTYQVSIEVLTKEEADQISALLSKNGFTQEVTIIEVSAEVKLGRGNGGQDTTEV